MSGIAFFRKVQMKTTKQTPQEEVATPPALVFKKAPTIISSDVNTADKISSAFLSLMQLVHRKMEGTVGEEEIMTFLENHSDADYGSDEP